MALCGCASWQRAPLDATAGLYDEATLRYEIDAAKLGTPMVAARVEAQQVSYDAIPTTPVAGQCTGVLVVEYPCAEAAPGMARATVEVHAAEARIVAGENMAAALWRRVRRRAGGGGQTHEKWVLDIPRSQLDAVVERLNQGGFFGEQAEVPGGVELAVTLSGAKTKKTWTQLPELDALVTRVRGQGQLVEYERPAGAARWGSLDRLLAARAAEERRTGSLWPTGTAPQIAARVPGGAFPMPSSPAMSAPAMVAARPQVSAVQPVSYLAPVQGQPAGGNLGSPQPEIVPLPPVGGAAALVAPAAKPANVPPEMPLSAVGAPVGDVARLPSPPANVWR